MITRSALIGLLGTCGCSNDTSEISTTTSSAESTGMTIPSPTTGGLGGSGIVDGTRGASPTTDASPSTGAGTTVDTEDSEPEIVFDVAGKNDFLWPCTEGLGTCDPITEFCRVTVPGLPGGDVVSGCDRLPQECLPEPSCECLLSYFGKGDCEVMMDGVILFTWWHS